MYNFISFLHLYMFLLFLNLHLFLAILISSQLYSILQNSNLICPILFDSFLLYSMLFYSTLFCFTLLKSTLLITVPIFEYFPEKNFHFCRMFSENFVLVPIYFIWFHIVFFSVHLYLYSEWTYGAFCLEYYDFVWYRASSRITSKCLHFKAYWRWVRIRIREKEWSE